ncbi:MAG: hypothetical protein LBP55_08085 [Candidatus Adiutrix sp.]|jgi:hypothetical protein|nr:hypothetical protein [Candidatus Adiutrix sp.]
MKFLRPLTIFMALLAVAGLTLNPSRAGAQSDDQLKMDSILARTMASQELLTEADVIAYLNNLEPIYRLRFEPGRQQETIRNIGVWSEERFAYVITKMASGLSRLFRPGDPRNNGLADFARPTPAEEALIRRYQDDLGRALEAIQVKYPNP